MKLLPCKDPSCFWPILVGIFGSWVDPRCNAFPLSRSQEGDGRIELCRFLTHALRPESPKTAAGVGFFEPRGGHHPPWLRGDRIPLQPGAAEAGHARRWQGQPQGPGGDAPRMDRLDLFEATVFGLLEECHKETVICLDPMF